MTDENDLGADAAAGDAESSTVPIPQLSHATQTFTVAYPFIRGEYERWDCDENPPYKVPSWTPGIRSEIVGPEGDTDTFADGVGCARFTLISSHKPGKYPERVFYTRTWIDPDGKQFGKTKLRITTRPVFLRLTRGYGYEYQIKGCAECKAMFWASRDHRGHAMIGTGNPASNGTSGSVPSEAK